MARPLRRGGNAATGSFYQDFAANEALDMDGGQINNLADGTAATDAVTLQQLEAAVEANTVSGTADGGLTAGQPVYKTATAGDFARARADDDTKALVPGVAATTVADNDPVDIIMRGMAPGVLTGATPGTPYYLAAAGGLTTSLPAAGNRYIFIGEAYNATDLLVDIRDYGKVPA